MRRLRSHSRRGVTLLELTVALAIFSLFAIGAYSAFGNLFRSSTGLQAQMDADDEVDQLLHQTVRGEIRRQIAKGTQDQIPGAWGLPPSCPASQSVCWLSSTAFPSSSCGDVAIVERNSSTNALELVTIRTTCTSVPVVSQVPVVPSIGCPGYVTDVTIQRRDSKNRALETSVFPRSSRSAAICFQKQSPPGQPLPSEIVAQAGVLFGSPTRQAGGVAVMPIQNGPTLPQLEVEYPPP